MPYEIVKTVGQTVVLGNGSQFFTMRKMLDGSHIRSCGDLELSVMQDFDYAAIGAKLYKSQFSALRAERKNNPAQVIA